MKCEDVEKVLPELLDGAPDSAFQSEFESHLHSCADCSDLFSDLRFIASEARQLEASEEPPQRVWVRIAAELRAEGLIKDEPGAAFAGPVLVPTQTRRRWSALWLAPVAAAILAAGAYLVGHSSGGYGGPGANPVANPVANNEQQIVPVATVASPTPVTSTPVTPPTVRTPVVASAPLPIQAPKAVAHETKTATSAIVATEVASPAPSTEDQQFLSVVSTLSPSMRVTYERQLQAVNADIRETQAYVDRNPGDPDARQHLMDAYRQKELLYQIALDRIQ